MCKKSERGWISAALTQLCTNLTQHLSPTHKTVLCKTMSPCHQINNECWFIHSRRTRKNSSSRVTGSHTLGKQLGAFSCFTVPTAFFFSFFFSAARISRNFSPGSKQHVSAAAEKLQTPARKVSSSQNDKRPCQVPVIYAGAMWKWKAWWMIVRLVRHQSCGVGGC